MRLAAPTLELGEGHNPRLSQRRQTTPFDATGRAEEGVIRRHKHRTPGKNVGVKEPRGSPLRILYKPRGIEHFSDEGSFSVCRTIRQRKPRRSPAA